MKRLAGCALALLLAAPCLAGDASGFDHAAIDRCLADASTQGARADCAGTGMESCLDYARGKYGGNDPDFPLANCLDASHQAWEAKLTGVYQAALEDSDQPEPLRRVERSWIAFREALCDRAGETGGDLARARCMRDETARQAALLMALGAGE
ncbi:lysozyme inhibitor LprI family protein [Paracoccus binzhouensis]|uniref:lysozyme inhibitor LprI family protein n=1 Tax=Paracoccus binzhouensis TaxID=2796149 RepID=UPI0018EEDC67|nr:lysozyme inhibitor LprI family protein [Paracoccus binzhouensis]